MKNYNYVKKSCIQYTKQKNKSQDGIWYKHEGYYIFRILYKYMKGCVG